MTVPNWLRFFAEVVYFQPDAYFIHKIHKAIVALIYTVFLCVSVIPEFIDAISLFNIGDPDSDRGWGLELFIGEHMKFILPAATFLRILAVFIQGFTVSRQWPSALSPTGLAVQAVVFTLVAVSWVMRVQYPSDPLLDFGSWYNMVGWPVVDYLTFGIGQGILLCLTGFPARNSGNDHGETEPLLGASEL